MAKLILVRHGKSEYNHKGLWTGHIDVELAAEGFNEARTAAEAIQDLYIHLAYTSALKRAQQTLDTMLETLERQDLHCTHHHALNERHYGIHSGKNKWEIKEEVGEEEFLRIRRSWDHPIPGGETLKDVFDRTVPYFTEEILPHLKSEKNVLLVSHGNTLRALAKHLENISEEAICELEIGTGEVHCYELDAEGTVTGKEIRSVNENKLKV